MALIYEGGGHESPINSYIIENPKHICDGYNPYQSTNFYICIAMIFLHILQPLIIRFPFFKKNQTLSVMVLVMLDVIFGFMILAIGSQECEPFFSNYLKLDCGISIFAALHMLKEKDIEKAELTLIGMQILENFHQEDKDFINDIINPVDDVHEEYHKEKLPDWFDKKLTKS